MIFPVFFKGRPYFQPILYNALFYITTIAALFAKRIDFVVFGLFFLYSLVIGSYYKVMYVSFANMVQSLENPVGLNISAPTLQEGCLPGQDGSGPTGN